MARKRELIDTGTDKRYVRRNKLGTSFVESGDVGRSLAADRRKRAKTKVKAGQGDKGDRAGPKAKAASKGRKKAASRKAPLESPAGGKRRARSSFALPEFIPFATCLLVDRPPNGPDWVEATGLDFTRRYLDELVPGDPDEPWMR